MRYAVVMLALMLFFLRGISETACAAPQDDPHSREEQPAGEGAVPHALIELRGDLLSVKVRHAPWEVVLQEFTRQTGIRVAVAGPLTGTLTQEFAALPLEQGLRRLFRDVNTLLFYASMAREGTMAATLTRVWLLPKEGSATEERLIRRSRAGLPLEPTNELAADNAHGEHVDALPVFDSRGNEETLREARFDPNQTLILLAAIKSDEPMTRLQALDFLRQSDQADEKIVLSALGEALNDEDLAVKGYAIQALAEREEPGAIEPLRQVFHNPDPSIRMMVLASIAHSGQGLSLLEEAVLDADPEVRSFATFWLEQAVAEGR
ncbi:MAG TPA: HEAT repeat domain-containing protein [Candidatus Tectomicrobia bacterium]